MSNSQNEQDDWGDDAAALFRDARRAHDPTPAERASFDRVFSRIQGENAPQPSAASRLGRASPVATAAKLSLVILGLTASYFAIENAGGDASAPHLSVPPQTAEDVALPPPAAGPEQAESAPPSAQPDSVRPVREARHHEDDSTIRSAPRRSRANTGRQRSVAARTEEAVAAKAPAYVVQEQVPSALHNEQAQVESTPQRSASAEEKPARREEAVAPRVQESVAAAPAEPTPSATPPAPSVTELSLLKRMQAALRAADFATALVLCAEHERRWPHGTFEVEREGVHAIASCSLGTDDALSLAKHFLASHPHASLAMRVSSACRKQLKQGR